MSDTTNQFDVDSYFSLVLHFLSMTSTAITVQTELVWAKRFYRFVKEMDIQDVRAITEEDAMGFIMMPSRHGSVLRRPSESTQKSRRSAIRSIFRTARQLGYPNLDPTADILIDPLGNPQRKICSIADIEALRKGAPMGMVTSGLPAILAFAEAGAANSEIRHLRGTDVEFESFTVSLPGTGSLNARTNSLTAWGGQVLEARLAELSSLDLIVVSTM